MSASISDPTRASAHAAVRAMSTPASFRTPCYAGNAPIQHRPDFLAIGTPETSTPTLSRRSFERSHDATILASTAASLTLSHSGKSVSKNSTHTRMGAHVGHRRSNPLEQARLDPLAERTLKIKDPVAYHVYCNQRPWVTQSTIVGEHLRARSPPRVPDSAPVGASKREALQALRLTSPRAIGDNIAPGDMDAVTSTRQGHVPSPPRARGEMVSVSRKTYVDLRQLPEPPTCKTTTFHDRPFYSKYVVETDARDAIDSMWNLDGSLRGARPEGVHPSVWRSVNKRYKAASLGDPHEHKRRAASPWRTAGSATLAAVA